MHFPGLPPPPCAHPITQVLALLPNPEHGQQRLSLSPRWEPLPWGRQVQAGLACPSADNSNVARAVRDMELVLPVFHN